MSLTHLLAISFEMPLREIKLKLLKDISSQYQEYKVDLHPIHQSSNSTEEQLKE